MRVESKRPYGLPNLIQEAKDSANDKISKSPEKASNAQGDQFELSPEQKVTQSALESLLQASPTSALTPERTAEIKSRLAGGYYLSEQGAAQTAQSLADFHKR